MWSFQTDLFVSHGFCRVNMRNHIAWCDEHKNTDSEGCKIDEYHQWYVELHRCLTYVVGLRVKRYDTCVFLYQYNTQPDDITPNETLSDDEYREPEEGMSDDAVS